MSEVNTYRKNVIVATACPACKVLPGQKCIKIDPLAADVEVDYVHDDRSMIHYLIYKER